MTHSHKTQTDLPKLAQTIFFRRLPETYFTRAPIANALQLIETMLILISMERFNSALVTALSAAESLLTRDDSDGVNRDKRSLRNKLHDFEKEQPGRLKEFVDTSTEQLGANVNQCLDIRNTVTHSGYSHAHDDASAEQILDVAWPLIERLYSCVFGEELRDALVVEVAQQFEHAVKIRSASRDGDHAAVALRPLAWTVQQYISPNFAPGFLWDLNGEQIDFSDLIHKRTDAFREVAHFDDEILPCPICDEISFSASFSFDSPSKPFGLHIKFGACGNCRARISDTREGRILGDVLFAHYLEANEKRIAAEYGLKE